MSTEPTTPKYLSKLHEFWVQLRNTVLIGAALVLILGTTLYAYAGQRPWRLVWAVPAVFIFLSLQSAFGSVHPPRWLSALQPKPADANLPSEAVVLHSRDGLLLNAWYIPGTSGAAVILAHGLSGSSGNLVSHAIPLVLAGYAVVLLDLRAHGRSHGEISSYGVREAYDILGALDYLRSRPEVDATRIYALGISLGAQAVLRAAAQDAGLRALVLEGLGPMSIADHPTEPRTLLRRLYMPFNRLTYAVGNWMAAIPEPESTTQVLRRLERPVLLIACGRGSERAFNRLFSQAAGPQAELWELPTARHANAYLEARDTYARRVTAFFATH